MSGRGLSDGLITRPEESYRLWRVVVCDQETSKTRRLKPATGLWKIQPRWAVTPGKQTNKQMNCSVFWEERCNQFHARATNVVACTKAQRQHCDNNTCFSGSVRSVGLIFATTVTLKEVRTAIVIQVTFISTSFSVSIHSASALPKTIGAENRTLSDDTKGIGHFIKRTTSDSSRWVYNWQLPLARPVRFFLC
jgi:hypothetical protein